MTTRPDTTVIEDWIDAQPLEDLAAAMRSDSAAYRDLTDGVEPVWRDLFFHFRVWGVHDDHIQSVGERVTEYGQAVGRGGDSIANALEDCASSLRSLDKKRQPVLERAREARLGLAHNPEPSLNEDGSIPEDWDLQQNAYARATSDASDVELDIINLDVEYREIMIEASDAIDSLDDDGGEPGSIPWGLILDVGIFALGVFIPPAGIAAAAIKTAYTSYQGRMRELKEEHPYLTDADRKNNATVYAALMTPVATAGSVAAGSAGRAAASRATQNGAAREVADGATNWIAGNVGSRAAGNMGLPDDGQGPSGSTGIGPQPSPESNDPLSPVRPPLAPQPDLNDPDRIRETKDYDRDGYTDAPFRPGTTRTVTMPNTDYTDMAEAGPAPEKVVTPPWYESPYAHHDGD